MSTKTEWPSFSLRKTLRFQDKYIDNALSNCITFAVTGILFVGVYAVYQTLQAFVKPMLWSLLIGCLLHPIKTFLASLIQSWLQATRDSGTPIVIRAQLIPFLIVDRLSDVAANFVFDNVYEIILLLGLMSFLYFVPLISMLSSATEFSEGYLSFVSHINATMFFTGGFAILLAAFFGTETMNARLNNFSIIFYYLCTTKLVTMLPSFLQITCFFFITFLLIYCWLYDIVMGCNLSSARKEEKKLDKPSSSAMESEKSKVHEGVLVSPLRRCFSFEEQTVEAMSSGRSLGDHYLLLVVVGLVFIHLSQSSWTLKLLPIFIFMFLGKKFAAQLGVWQKIVFHSSKLVSLVKADNRIRTILPLPIKRGIQLLMKLDKQIIVFLEQYIDSAVSFLMVLALLCTIIVFSIFCCIQVHSETGQMGMMVGELLNKSIHSDLNQWLPEKAEMLNAYQSLINKVYIFGRNYIHEQIHYMVDGDADAKHEMVQQLVKVWDNVYRSWFAVNKTHSRYPLQRQYSVVDDSTTNLTTILNHAMYDLNFFNFLKENVAVLRSVLQSVWAVMMSNMSIVLSLFTSTLSLLSFGGSAIINFVVSSVVFVTALFYLLSLSGRRYLPIDWLSQILPVEGQNSQIFQTAIKSVFVASFKMATFYSLFTWLTHSIFSLRIVFLPSVLAGLFAAVPLIGTYVVCLPGMLQLWLLHQRPVAALILLLLHLLPPSFVDSAILAEIKGGHPYLTGLTIVGGIYWLGLEGCIIGPLLLCCLLVFLNISSTFLHAPNTPQSAPLASTPKVAK